MGLRAGDFDILSYLWDQLPKSPDPDHVTYTAADIDTLWHMGFVDIGLCPLTTWRQAFATNRQPDGKFLLTREDFLSLDRYRYKGEIYAPFDADLINEGQYTDEGFQELVEQSLVPSCSLGRAELGGLVDGLKARIRQPNGLLRIEALAKREIARWLKKHPSPLRRLELLFSAMLEAQAEALGDVGTPPAAKSPEQIARVEASTFTMLSAHDPKDRQRALHDLTKAKDAPSPPTPTGGGTPLKQLRRSRRGVLS
ncbi:MAG: hypothetical protein HY696_00600 [Deltaproteobacteria bacterium]|nr:hypothetical protein [Deltaproteobacteria bacterium]